MRLSGYLIDIYCKITLQKFSLHLHYPFNILPPLPF